MVLKTPDADLVFDHVIGEQHIPDPDPAHWREQLKQVARTQRATILRHRDIVAVSLGRIPMGPNALRYAERVLAILRAGGVPDQLAVAGHQLLIAVVNGFTLDETTGASPAGGETPCRPHRMLPAITSPRSRPRSSRTSRRWPITSPTPTPTSASSSCSTSSSTGWRSGPPAANSDETGRNRPPPGWPEPSLNSGNADGMLRAERRNLLRPLTGPLTVRRMAVIMNMVRRVRRRAVATGVGLASAH